MMMRTAHSASASEIRSEQSSRPILGKSFASRAGPTSMATGRIPAPRMNIVVLKASIAMRKAADEISPSSEK